VIPAGAVLLPKDVIEFGGERQFANEIAEGGFIEHNFSNREERNTCPGGARENTKVFKDFLSERSVLRG
jgi:hypothetical protein